jgi:hypothetical protein
MNACTSIDHSLYVRSTNHYGYQLQYEKDRCSKCGLPSYDAWCQTINYDSIDKNYWKKIFTDVTSGGGFWHENVPVAYLGPTSSLRPSFLEFKDDGTDPAMGRKPLDRKLLIQEIKVLRYHHRCPSLKKNYYPDENIQLKLLLDDASKDMQCVDNFRIAALDNRKDMKRYRKMEKRGCCGSFDQEVTVNGRKFMIGFNYGH